MVDCPACSTSNPTDAAFCMKCGTALSASCAKCGADLPAEAAFCMKCGHRVAADEAPVEDPDAGLRKLIPRELLSKLESAASVGAMQGERRTVTMLFCDVQGSTTAAEQLDPEEWAEIMNGAFEHLIAPVYRYEGTLARLMGDAILAFFGAPIGHEDDPERAVRAGLEILDAIGPYCSQVSRAWNVSFDVRVGINTGLVVVGAVGSDLRVEYTAMGDAVNVAARMEQTAAPGTVQISESTRALVDKLFEFDSLGAIDVKGRSEPVEAHRVVKALPRPEKIRGIEGLDAAMVGRDEELARISGSLQAVAGGQGRIVSVQGEAGLGKSRLVAEARAALGADRDGYTWVTGRALSYETTVPLAPVQRLMRQVVGAPADADPMTLWQAIDATTRDVLPGRASDIAPYIGALLGADVPADIRARVEYLEPGRLRSEAFRAIGELLAALAGRSPLIAVFEDLHWADSASIDLVMDLLGLIEFAPIGLVLVFRPRRDEPSWEIHEAAGREHGYAYEAIQLSPLARDDARSLVSALLDIDGLPDRVRELILSKSEGNPYFIEEVIKSLIDRGVLIHSGGRWVATSEIVSISVPDTLSAVITTRLDRLDDRSRRVAQAASVLGREFKYDELAAVLDDLSGIDQGLVDLQRREILRETARIPKRQYRFRHALMQQAVYDTVLLRRRTEIHAVMADFLERLHPERVEDIADHHLSARQKERALPHLVEAGSRALATYALPEAIHRFEQALEILDGQDHADGNSLRVVLEGIGRAKEMRFDFGGAAQAYARLRQEGQERGDLAMGLSGRNKSALISGMMFADTENALDELAATEQAARAGSEESSLAEACMYQCFLRTARGEFDQVEFYMSELTALGERLQDSETMLFGMVHLANTLMLATKADLAIEKGEKALAKAEEYGNLRYQAEILTMGLPFAHLQRGEVETALSYVERGLEIATQIGHHMSEVFAAIVQGKVAMGQGYYADALALFRRAEAAAQATGMPPYIALGKCVTGTCYSSIGGPYHQKATEIHTETLEVSDMPMGDQMGAWVWSEIGHCALESGDVDTAEELFHRALDRRTVAMYMSRHEALQGLVDVAVARGHLDEARDHLDTLREYVQDHGMTNALPILLMTEAKVAGATGDHAGAVGFLDECLVELAGKGFKRTELDVHAVRVRELRALGDSESAQSARADFEAVAREILSRIGDDDFRAAFGQSVLDMVEEA